MRSAGDGGKGNVGPEAQNEEHWVWGIFYFAPGDPRTFVPKRGSTSYFPRGSTVNLARWEGKAFIASVVGILFWGLGGTIRDRRLIRAARS